jgi:hypothetical protein
MVVPAVWVGVFLFPIMLIRNHQVYYYQESLVGTVLLVGVCLDRAERPLLIAWALVVALIGLSGFITNRRSYYAWEYTADQAKVVLPIVESNKDNPPQTMTFVTSTARRPFWVFAIGGPFVPHLLGSPDTVVRIVDSASSVEAGEQVHQLADR